MPTGRLGRLPLLAVGLGILALSGCSGYRRTVGGVSDADLRKIQHVIVIYGENRSFDNLYGLFPGANGIAQASPASALQLDRDGVALKLLPPVWTGKPPAPDPAFPNLGNKPFRIDAPPISKPLSIETRDLVHRFYQNQEQIDGGKNDKFAAVSDAGGLTMGHYDGAGLPLWAIARQYTLADNFFMGAFGGSFLNHFWLVCACTPQFADAPPALRAQLGADGRLERAADSPASAMDGPPRYVADGAVTGDGYAVNTMQPAYQPSAVAPAAGGDARFADLAKNPLPPQTALTVGDTLSEKHVSWAWYGGAWDEALADGMQPAAAKRNVIYNDAASSPNFQPHHQPFNYFASFAPGTAARAEHLRDARELMAGIERGELPAVVFYKPQGSLNEHPGYTDVLSGDRHIAELVQRIQASRVWSSTLIVITYDENGGFWDHVAPPRGDRWGPGTRIPAIFVSPFVKRRYVDATPMDTTSIVKFLTRRFALRPLPGVRSAVGDLTSALTF